MRDQKPVIDGETILTIALELFWSPVLILVQEVLKSDENDLDRDAKYQRPRHQYRDQYLHERYSSFEPSPFRPCEPQLVNAFHPMANEANLGRGMVILKPQVPTVKVRREYVLEA